MIKDVMVRLDGSAADEVRLSAVNDIADLFDSQVTGLFLNVMPLVVAPEDGVGAMAATELMEAAKEAGDKVEARLRERLNRLQKPVELRRFRHPERCCCGCSRTRGAHIRHVRRIAAEWRAARARAPDRVRSFRFGPTSLSGAKPQA